MSENYVIVHLPTWGDVERLVELIGRRDSEYFKAPFHRYEEFCVKVREKVPGKYSFLTWGAKEHYSNYSVHVTIDDFAVMCGEEPEEFFNNDFMEVLLNGSV